MGALQDISDAMAGLGPVKRGWRRFVLVGKSAGPAVVADLIHGAGGTKLEGVTWQDSLKAMPFGPVPPMIPTDQFDGWEIVDRPTP